MEIDDKWIYSSKVIYVTMSIASAASPLSSSICPKAKSDEIGAKGTHPFSHFHLILSILRRSAVAQSVLVHVVGDSDRMYTTINSDNEGIRQ